MAVLSEIPDYYQDMLAGKWSLVFGPGKQKAVVLLKLCLAALFIFLTLGVILKSNSFLNGLYLFQFSIYIKVSGYVSIDVSMLDDRNTSPCTLLDAVRVFCKKN